VKGDKQFESKMATYKPTCNGMTRYKSTCNTNTCEQRAEGENGFMDVGVKLLKSTIVTAIFKSSLMTYELVSIKS
jgi:hypothetical protein